MKNLPTSIPNKTQALRLLFLFCKRLFIQRVKNICFSKWLKLVQNNGNKSVLIHITVILDCNNHPHSDSHLHKIL